MSAEASMSDAEKFEVFHEFNAHIYDRLVERCREWAATGHTMFGLRSPWERMRWELGVRTNTDEPWKLNDHLLPYYARMIVAQEPDLAGLLSLRRADEADAWAAERWPEIFGQDAA